MRELSPEAAEQIRGQLERAAAGKPARTWGEGASPERVASAREAVIEATFLLAAVDGKVTPLEVGQFAECVEAALGSTADGADGDIEGLVAKLAARLAAESWDQRLDAVKAALAGTDLGETAYRLAASVAFVDDTIEHAEAAGLDTLAAALGIAEDRTRAILAEVRRDLFGS